MAVRACGDAILRNHLAVVKEFWIFTVLMAVLGSGAGQSVPFPPDPNAPLRDFSDAAKASILTCSPGSELYSAFGHTAIRVTDLAANPPLDRVYNFGTFQFSDGFYGRFIQGELIYSLSTSTFGGFLEEYIRSGRGVSEQELALSNGDIARLDAHLLAHAHPDHRDYRYLFLYDNCATRVITVLEDVFGSRLTVDCVDRRDSTFRDLLRAKLGGIPLTRFGIDVVLGLPVDAPLGKCGAAFLPDHLAVEWFAGETKESGGYRGSRINVAYRYNIYDHIGLYSTLRSQKQTSFPRCYEMLGEPTLFQVEAFSPKQCPKDDIWPCQVQNAEHMYVRFK